MELQQVDIELLVNKYKADGLAPLDRYRSFDYCYNYFQRMQRQELLLDTEKSCLTLGFYLASWGMFRGSSFLLNQSVKYFQSTVEYIASLDRANWQIDVDNYDEGTISRIIDIYEHVREKLVGKGHSDVVLVSKTLLGVFGFVPAFDENFCSAFRTIFHEQCGFRRLNRVSLSCIKDFYTSNKKAIDTLSRETFTTDFSTGMQTAIKYSKAKIIDMYGFMRGAKPKPMQSSRMHG